MRNCPTKVLNFNFSGLRSVQNLHIETEPSQIENHIGYRSKMPLVASFSEAKRFGVHDDPCGLV